MAGEDTTAVALAHYRRQQRHARRTADRVQELWRQIDGGDLTGSWDGRVGPLLVDAVVAGQLAAASEADAYVEAVVAAEGAQSQAVGRVRPSAFAGRAADGRALESLLYLPVVTTKTRIAAGQTEVDALLAGLEQMLKIAASEVADAGRGATGASMAGNRTIQGWVRVVQPPACSRCIVLAGKEFGWNRGFQRHPRCDCIHLPTTLIARGRRGRGFLDPKDYFTSLSAAEQDRIFTAAGARAIRDGADITTVVNARRGMYTTEAYGRTVRATRESTTRRGTFYRQERARAAAAGQVPLSGRGFRLMAPRLLPEEIYRLAESRTEAIAMLRRFGYLT